MIPSTAAHAGSLTRAVCQPAIWLTAAVISTCGCRAACRANERTSSLRWAWMNWMVSGDMVLGFEFFSLLVLYFFSSWGMISFCNSFLSPVLLQNLFLQNLLLQNHSSTVLSFYCVLAEGWFAAQILFGDIARLHSLVRSPFASHTVGGRSGCRFLFFPLA